jgi:hypothetical protein
MIGDPQHVAPIGGQFERHAIMARRVGDACVDQEVQPHARPLGCATPVAQLRNSPAGRLDVDAGLAELVLHCRRLWVDERKRVAARWITRSAVVTTK